MKIKFAGTGDGRGIPVIGCKCDRCTLAREEGGKNRRRTVSFIVTSGSETIILDTPSSIGVVLNEERIFRISAIFLSHKHYDHLGGITAFEYWPERIPVYGNMSVLGNFEITDKLYEKCEFHVLRDRKSIKVGRIKVTPFQVSHTVPTFGLVFMADNKRVVHFSDMSGTDLSDYEKRLVKTSDIAIFHTPGYEGGTDHVDVMNVVSIAKRYPSTRFVLSHIGHNNLLHDELVVKIAPCKNMVVAYDRMEIKV